MGCDTICDLPDSLLTQILLNLPTKDCVKTSVLSTRWRNIWLSVPGLDLATYDFRYGEVFARFINRFMEFKHGSHLKIFKILHQARYYDFDGVMELISIVIDRGIQHLDVTMHLRYRDSFMSQNIYKSNTLVSLKLENVELKNPEFAVSLPCLNIMHLSKICYGKDGPLVVEKLISGCPVLEDLKLFRLYDRFYLRLFLHVRSQTLKRFVIIRGDTNILVEIDAPKLKYMSLSNSQSDRIVVKNISSLFMLDIHTNSRFKCDILSPLLPEDLIKRAIFCDFLTGIYSVRHMIICKWTLEALYCYSKLGPIPKFHNLYHLQAAFSSSLIQLLPVLLEICPNLKRLILDYYVTMKQDEIVVPNMPCCLTLTLEYVEIRELIMKDDNGIKLANYFLENSAVLKKLTLSSTHCFKTNQQRDSYKKLLTSTKLSPSCQVIIE